MKSSKLPIQSAPVNRIATGASISDHNGVDPSFDRKSLIEFLPPDALLFKFDKPQL
jgi:hypothetical protein